MWYILCTARREEVFYFDLLEHDITVARVWAGDAQHYRCHPDLEESAWTRKMDEQISLDMQYAVFKAQVQEYGHPMNEVWQDMRYELARARATDPNAR